MSEDAPLDPPFELPPVPDKPASPHAPATPRPPNGAGTGRPPRRGVIVPETDRRHRPDGYADDPTRKH